MQKAALITVWCCDNKESRSQALQHDLRTPLRGTEMVLRLVQRHQMGIGESLSVPNACTLTPDSFAPLNFPPLQRTQNFKPYKLCSFTAATNPSGNNPSAICPKALEFL